MSVHLSVYMCARVSVCVIVCLHDLCTSQMQTDSHQQKPTHTYTYPEIFFSTMRMRGLSSSAFIVFWSVMK